MRLKDGGLLWTRVDDEIVVLDRRTDMYLGVNRAGAELWDLLVRGCTRAELVDRLVSRWGVDPEQAGSDADDFVAGLGAEGLLE